MSPVFNYFENRKTCGQKSEHIKRVLDSSLTTFAQNISRSDMCVVSHARDALRKVIGSLCKVVVKSSILNKNSNPLNMFRKLLQYQFSRKLSRQFLILTGVTPESESA
jgi:hypothetical protein